MGLDNLTRTDLLTTYQGIRSLQTGVPPSEIGVSRLNDMSDEALIHRIERHAEKLEGGELVGTNQPSNTDLNLRFTDEAGLPVPPNTSLTAARVVLSQGVQGGTPDMFQFHALLALYGSDKVDFDNELSADEIAAAQTILDNDLQIAPARMAFEEAARIEAQTEAERLANEAEAAQRAAEIEAAQTDLEGNIDAALAARGLIEPDQIGKLTETERMRGLNELMTNEAEYMQQEGTFGAGRLRLDHVQDKAFGTTGWEVQDGALEVATSGLRDMHMAEEVQTWLESDDVNQIKMAQAVLGLPAAGQIDQETFDKGNAYIQDGYETDITKLDFVENVTGSTNPSMFYRASNEGRIYIPDMDTAEGERILTNAGMDEFDIEDIMFAPTAKELSELRASLGETEPTAEQQELLNSETREEIIAHRYLYDPSFYSAVMEARNEIASEKRLDIEAPAETIRNNLTELAQTASENGEALGAEATQLSGVIGSGEGAFNSILDAASGNSLNAPTDGVALAGLNGEAWNIPSELTKFIELKGDIDAAELALKNYENDSFPLNTERGIMGAVSAPYGPFVQEFKNNITEAQNAFMQQFTGMTPEATQQVMAYLENPDAANGQDSTVVASGATFEADAPPEGTPPTALTGQFGPGYTPGDNENAGQEIAKTFTQDRQFSLTS